MAMLGADPDPITAATQAVLARNGEAFATGDLEAILANYAPDAVIIRPGKIYRGHRELREMFSAVLRQMTSFTPAHSTATVSGRLGLLTWLAISGDGQLAEGVDSFLVENDRIVAQSYVGAL